MIAALRGAALLAGLAAIGLALRFATGGAAHGWLVAAGMRHGAAGYTAFLAVAAALVALGVPRQVTAFAAGYAFGAGVGLCLAVVASLLGLLADFWWARLVARDWARRRLSGRLARLDRFLAEHPFAATLTLRLLPLGSNVLLNLFGGLSAIPLLPFFLASALGYVPQSLVFALLGSGVRVGRSTELALAVGLFAVSAGTGLVLLRRTRAGRDAQAARMAEASAPSPGAANAGGGR